MQIETLLLMAVAAVMTAFICWLIWGKRLSRENTFSKGVAEELRVAQKTLHLYDLESISQRKAAEDTHHEFAKGVRTLAFAEGRELGHAESQRDQILEISRQRETFGMQLIEEKAKSVAEARATIQAEYERQTKLFSVKIAPYVKIVEDRSLFNKKHEFVSGYQYQLMINGMPAFQPHLIAERTEIKSEINPVLEKAVLEFAKVAAHGAIDLYLGTNSQFARLAPEIVERTVR